MAGVTRANVDFAIPVEIARGIISGATNRSVALQLGTRRTMSHKELRIPVVTALPTVGWLNGDTGVKPSGVISIGGPTITAEELAVIVRAPEAVLDDLDYDLWAEIRPGIESAFAEALDAAVFFGTGAPTSFPTGGLLQQCVTRNKTVTAGSGMDLAEDISDTMTLVEGDGYSPDAFATNPRVRGMLRGLRDDSGGFLYQPSMVSGTPNMIYGLPSFVMRGIDAASRVVLFCGEWANLIIAVRQDITYKFLDQATIEGVSLAETDQIALRCVFRVGWNIVVPLTRDNPNNNTRLSFSALLPGASGDAASAQATAAKRPATAKAGS